MSQFYFSLNSGLSLGLFLCIALLTNLSEAQNVTAIYHQAIEISEKADPESEKDMISSQRHSILMKKTEEITNQLRYELKIKGKVATFGMLPFMAKGNQQHLINLANVYSKGLFYKDISGPEYLWQTEVFGTKYLIRLLKPEWELISGESVLINGYRCEKAETYRTSYGSEGELIKTKVTAWYTSEIPLSHGPLGYSGLPGLIVKLDIKDRSLILQEITTEKNLNLENPEGEAINLKEYYALFASARRNFR